MPNSSHKLRHSIARSTSFAWSCPLNMIPTKTPVFESRSSAGLRPARCACVFVLDAFEDVAAMLLTRVANGLVGHLDEHARVRLRDMDLVVVEAKELGVEARDVL